MSGAGLKEAASGIRGGKAAFRYAFPRPDSWPARLGGAALQVPSRFGRLLIRAYRVTFSPLVGFNCRHLPTCSEYGDEAIARYGLWAGGWMTAARLCRCHPLGTSGLDFVCEEIPPRARWYLPWRYARWRGTNEGPQRAD